MQSNGARTHMLELPTCASARRVLPAKVFQFREKLVLSRMFYAAPPLGGISRCLKLYLYIGILFFSCVPPRKGGREVAPFSFYGQRLHTPLATTPRRASPRCLRAVCFAIGLQESGFLLQRKNTEDWPFRKQN